MVNKHLAIILQKHGLKSSYAENILYGGLSKTGNSKTGNSKTGDSKTGNSKTGGVGPVGPVGTVSGDVSVAPEALEPISTKKDQDLQVILAKKIVNALKNALYFNNKMDTVNNENDSDHEKKVQEDIEKIKNLVVSKKIDMLYGGGFLIFDSTLNIKQMIYTCYKDGKMPVFSSLSVNPNTEGNSINKILKSNMKPYVSSDIAGEITKIAPPSDFTVDYADVHFKKSMLRSITSKVGVKL